MVRNAKAIRIDCLDELVFRRNHHVAVAVDHAGLAVDINLREARLIVTDDAVLGLDHLASVFVDEAIKAADADGGPVVRKLADPII
jgi:hypothetical protein